MSADAADPRSSMRAAFSAFFGLVRPPLAPILASATLLLLAPVFEAFTMTALVAMLELLAGQTGGPGAGKTAVLAVIREHLPALRFRHLLLLILGGVALSETLKHAAVYWSELRISRMARALEHDLRTRIFRRYLSFSKSYFDRRNIGDLSHLMLVEVLHAGESIRMMHSLAQYALLFAVHLTIMFLISWPLTLFSLVILPLSYLILREINRRLAVSSRMRLEIDERMSSLAADALQNMTLIRSYANETVEAERFERVSDESRRTLHSVWKKLLFGPHAQEAVVTFAIVTLIGAFTFVLLGERIGNLGMFLAFFVALKRFTSSVTLLSGSWTQVLEKSWSVRAILRVFDDRDKVFIADGSRPFPGLRRKVEFRGVKFGYEEGRMVLDGIDLTVEKGRMVALVGPSGAGKTTLAYMIPRFYDPVEGEILIDGVRTSEFRLEELRRGIAVVDQNLYTFNASVRENIAYGLKRAVSDAEIEGAARRASLHDFVRSLPLGYDTPVGERGVRLSGGERQRLAIARALLKDPDIFIFDEATSSLDLETELEVKKAIEEVRRGRTVIVIAHRISTIRNADEIVVLDHGRIAEQGPFERLRHAQGLFSRYWALHETA